MVNESVVVYGCPACGRIITWPCPSSCSPNLNCTCQFPEFVTIMSEVGGFNKIDPMETMKNIEYDRGVQSMVDESKSLGLK